MKSMRNKAYFTVLGCLAAFCAGCVPGQTAKRLPVAFSLDGAEQADYRVLTVGGKPRGNARFKMRRKEDKLFVEKRVLYAGSETTASVVLDAGTLAPIDFQKEFNEKGKSLKIKAGYSPGPFVRVEVIRGGAKKWLQTPVPQDRDGRPSIYDNESLLFVLRFLKLKEVSSNGIPVTVFVPQLGLLSHTQIIPSGTEKVGGTPCFKLKILSESKQMHWAWYRIKFPHILVKYEGEGHKLLLKRNNLK